MYDPEKKYLTPKERWSFGIAGLGQNMAYGIMSSFLLAFYTDIVFPDALKVVTIIMIIARVWDAINDPIMGSIVDRTRTKLGKCRPYLMIAPFPIAVFTILIFYAPDLSLGGRLFYALFTYILWGMLYTISDVPFWALPSSMTPNARERADFLAFARILNGVGAALPFLVMELFKEETGYTKESFFYSAVLMAVIGAALFSLAYFNTKERIMPPSEKLSIIDNLKLLKVNKPLLLVLALGVLSFGRYVTNMFLIYATRDIFVNAPENISMIVLSAAFAIGMFPGMVLMPFFFKKFNYKQIAIAAGTGAFILQLIFFVVTILSGYDYYIALPFIFLAGFPFGIYNVITFVLTSESIDYLEWKTGKRAEGLGFSCQTFMNKMGAAVSAAVIPVMLLFINYVAPVMRTEEYEIPRLGMLAIFSLLPGISMLLSTIPMYFYDYLGEKKEKILFELAKTRSEENRIIEE